MSDAYYALWADHAEAGDRVGFGTFKTKEEAQARIEALVADGLWPESFDAILVNQRTGARWMFTNEWEAIEAIEGEQS